MNLKEELLKRSNLVQEKHFAVINPIKLSVSDVVSLAKKYAADMCKTQREQCANFLEDEKGTEYEDFIKDIKSLIRSAPLATEE